MDNLLGILPAFDSFSNLFNKILYHFIIVMSDTDTSAIDEKKNTSSKPKDALLNFVLVIAYQLAALGVLIIIGAMVLYTGKVAQSNILPTCLALYRSYLNGKTVWVRL